MVFANLQEENDQPKGVSTQFQCGTHTTLPIEDRAGGKYCYNCIIEAHQNQAHNLALRMLADWGMAEDATQEAFLSGYKAFKSFRGDNLKAWLLRIVANACKDMLRARKSRPAASLDYFLLDPEGRETPALDIPSSDESPEDYTLRRELGRTIQEGLQSLSQERRLAVVLVDVQGFSYEEVAQVASCSLGTLKSRLARARGEMRDFLLKHRELLPRQFRQDK